MGTIKQGILGGFSGKVGTVVGASWKGISYMRGQAQHVKNPRTAAQTYNRAALQLITDTLRPIIPTLRMTFAKSAGKMSEFNKAVQINYKKAIVNQDSQPVVDYSKLILSKGTLKRFSYLLITDESFSGEYTIEALNDDNSQIEYPGMIFFIYDKRKSSWFTGIVSEPFTTGEGFNYEGIPLLGSSSQFLGFACVYDSATGQVSDPIAEVEING